MPKNSLSTINMKRWLLILALCTATVSCKWYYKNFASTEECAEWYLERLNDADDINEYEAIRDEYNAWFNTLSISEQQKASKAVDEWYNNNESKAEKVEGSLGRVDRRRRGGDDKF